MNDKKLMNRAADNIRILAVSMVEKAKSGHPGGAMGGADFINILFSEFLVFDPEQPEWAGRDRFYLDPGHMSPMLYAALTLQRKFTVDDIKQFRQWGSITPGHPERDIAHGIENSSGPLGQGHAYAAGAAVAEKFLEARLGSTMMQHKIYAYISDGGIQEGISAEVGRLAGNLGLNNLIMFYDANDIQLSTECGAVMSEDTAMKYQAWDWNVLKIDGNDPDAIREALVAANKEERRPTLIIGETIMGKGALQADGSSYEHSIKTHGAPLGGDAYANTVKNLGGDIEDPFKIFPEVQKLYDDRAAELRKIVAERHLGVIAEQVPNMIVSSADLSNSDKTDGFLNKTHALTRDDFSGAFFQAGVSELAMACMCIGMMLHGGVITAMGTFFVFSDYMKPAIRMAALMRTPVKFVWSHDAFRVGEDGPTHEPVEQEAQIRLMEKLQNHAGQDSVRVFRPADSDAATVCWQMAMENMDTPTALIFSRQNVKSLPEGTDYQQTRKGAYVVTGSDEQFDVILVASGSEVSTCVAGAELLRKDGVKVRVVSAPSEGLFRRQSKEYQEQILPRDAKIFGLTAGLPVTLEGLVGANGKVFGLNSFGFSAPYTVLDEKLGFTPENVYEQVKAFLA